jgi:hypothetical protein
VAGLADAATVTVMSQLRQRTAGWTVPLHVWIAIAVAIAVVIMLVRVGASEQHSRRIPDPRSATIAVHRAGATDGTATRVSRSAADRLADIIDHLPQAPGGEQACGADDGSGDEIVFATSSGPVDAGVDLGGCLGVGIASHGHDWGVDRWDPDSRLRSRIDQDLAAARAAAP